MWEILTRWAGNRGEVATEWRFYFLPEGDPPSSLVPDVAYVSFDRMPLELGEWREEPTIAPDIAVEVISPYERRTRREVRTGMYVGFGSALVVVIDPKRGTIEMHEAAGTKTFRKPDVARCAIYPDLAIDTSALFRGM